MSEEIRDLRERLIKAKDELYKLERATQYDEEHRIRLAGKREGVLLALGYTEEYMR